MNIKRFFSALLALCLLLALSPAAAMAEEPDASSPREETMEEQLSGYFLVGTMNGWTPSEAYRFTWNASDPSTGVEYILLCTLSAGDAFKAVQVENGSIVTWYPDPGENYTVSAAQAGDKAVYFRPQYQSDWDGHFRIEDPPTYHVSTTVNSEVHGSIRVSPENARAGDLITVTVTPDEGYILKYIEAPSITRVNDSTYTFPMPGYDTTVYATFKLGPGFYFDNTNRVVPDYYVPEEKFSPSSSPFGEWERDTVLTEGNYLDVKAVYAPELASQKTGSYWCFQTMKLTYSSSSSRPKVTAEQAGHAMVFLTETEREGYIKAIHLDQSYMDESFVWDAWITVKNFRPIDIAAAEHGTVTAPADACESQIITLTVTPEEGYALDTLTVVDAEGHELPVENNAFTMPDAPVTVTATFKESLVQIDYPLWLGETRVNSLNKADILGDGTVHYDPATGTLTFDTARPAIPGIYDNGLTGNQLVRTLLYADGDLIINAPQGLELSTAELNCNGIYMPAGSLTVNGNLKIRSTYHNIFAFHTNFVLNGDLDIAGATFGLNVNAVKINGNVEATAGRNVISGGESTEITGDTIHVVSTDGSNTSMGISGHQGVVLTGTVEVESIDNCVNAGYGPITIIGDATLKSSKYRGIYGYNITVKGNLNLETLQDCVYDNASLGRIDIEGDVIAKCTSPYQAYAAISGHDVVIRGDVTAESKGYGILAKNGGVVTMISGTWTLDGGKSAIQAAGGIGIPDTHAIVEPAGGLVSQVGGNYCITQADGSTLATHALIRVPAADYAQVAGISISAKGNIGLNFYLYLPERLEADDGAYVTLDEEKALISQAAAVELGERSAYRFSLAVPAKEMGRKVTLKVFDGQDQAVQLRHGEEDLTETGLVCAVRDYLDWQIAESDDLKLVNLCKAMRDYGYCAQATFDYEAEDLPAPTGDLASVTAESLLDYEPVLQEGADSGLVHLGSSLLLKSETSLRHYFRLRSGQIGEYSFAADGQSLTPVQKGDSWYVEIPEITAKMLGNTPTLTVTRGGEQILSLRYGPLSYARCVLLENADETLADQVRALALYAQAAAEYFGE